MATNTFEVPDKYFDRLTWNMIDFIQNFFSVFLSNFALDMWVFHYLLKYVARECVAMVTNHTVTF